MTGSAAWAHQTSRHFSPESGIVTGITISRPSPCPVGRAPGVSETIRSRTGIVGPSRGGGLSSGNGLPRSGLNVRWLS